MLKAPKHPDLTMIARRLMAATTLVYDAETNGLDWRTNKTVGHVLTFSGDPADSFYLPIRHGGGSNMDPAKVNGLLASVARTRPTLRWVFFNGAFDLKFMHNDDIHPAGPLEDTSINAFLIDERQNKFSLDACCKFMNVQEKKGDDLYKYMAGVFGGEPDRNQMANYWRLSGLDPVGVDYATGDGTSTWQLWEKQQPELDAQELRTVWAVECRCIRVLHRMMIRGIRIDEERLEQVIRLVNREYDKAHSMLPKDFNEKAPSQLKKFFTDHGITDWPTTPKGNPSFGEHWLETNEPGKRIIKARKLRHLKNSFLTPMKERHLWRGRVHTNYNQTRGEEFGTITGRLSSNDPNLQQVHKRDKLLGSVFRSIFIPDDGMIWSSRDYSQIEPRLLAHYANVKVLLDGYLDDPPIDAHTSVAQRANIDRQSGKTLNQALLTGAGNAKAASMLGRPMAEAMQIVEQYFKSMPEIKPFQRRSSNVMLARGYVRSLLGRRARLEDPRFAYKTLNRLLQCGNADIIKKAMADVDEYYASEGDRVHLLNNIHDDLCDQFREDDRHIHARATEIMTDYGPNGQSVYIRVPLTIEDGEGPDWAVATYGAETVRASWQKMGDDYVQVKPKKRRRAA